MFRDVRVNNRTTCLEFIMWATLGTIRWIDVMIDIFDNNRQIVISIKIMTMRRYKIAEKCIVWNFPPIPY